MEQCRNVEKFIRNFKNHNVSYSSSLALAYISCLYQMQMFALLFNNKMYSFQLWPPATIPIFDVFGLWLNVTE